MFKHILVPVDGSPNAARAVDKAAGLAQAFGASVTLVTVIDNYPFAGVGGDFAYGQVEYLAAATDNANAALAKAASEGKNLAASPSASSARAASSSLRRSSTKRTGKPRTRSPCSVCSRCAGNSRTKRAMSGARSMCSSFSKKFFILLSGRDGFAPGPYVVIPNGYSS